ncbi:hypothetical protein TNCV_6511 [Trichonephila clavipes]|nr:hypothetical protein TNCV_6511 [Trichonephila clavipes]
MHRSPKRWVFSGTVLELVTRPATIRYLDHSATAAVWMFGSEVPNCGSKRTVDHLTIDERPRKFESLSSDKKNIRNTPRSPNFHTPPM